MLGSIVYIFGLLTAIILSIFKYIFDIFYIASPIAFFAICIYIFLKITEFILFKQNKIAMYNKLHNINKKLIIYLLFILLISLIKHILYPKSFRVTDFL